MRSLQGPVKTAHHADLVGGLPAKVTNTSQAILTQTTLSTYYKLLIWVKEHCFGLPLRQTYLGDVVGLGRNGTAKWRRLLVLLADEKGQGEGVLLQHFHQCPPPQGLLGAL